MGCGGGERGEQEGEEGDRAGAGKGSTATASVPFLSCNLQAHELEGRRFRGKVHAVQCVVIWCIFACF